MTSILTVPRQEDVVFSLLLWMCMAWITQVATAHSKLAYFQIT